MIATPTTAPSPATVRLGALVLTVPIGHSSAQLIRWHPQWWMAKLRPVVGPAADGMIRRIESGAARRWKISRAQLYQVAATQDWATTHTAVIAWGAGTDFPARYAPLLLRSLREKRAGALGDSWRAAPRGLEALWDAHFADAPPGLGRMAFGSKWLHAGGWGRIAHGAGPLVYDFRVWSALSRCAGWTHLHDPRGPITRGRRQSWLDWCDRAHDAALATRRVNSADVERSVFEHGRDCDRASGRGTACLNGDFM